MKTIHQLMAEINQSVEELKALVGDEQEEYEVEQERNADHANDNRI
jgi:hypothetical protein